MFRDEVRRAKLRVRAEKGVPAVCVLEFNTGEPELVEIVAEISDLAQIAAVFAGERRVAEPANRRNFHDPVLARKYARFQCLVRVVTKNGTTFVFATERGRYLCQLSEEDIAILAVKFRLIAAEWKRSNFFVLPE